MTLSDYMTQHGVSDATLAARCNCDRTRISRLRRGIGLPSVDLAKQIERATDGAVSAASLLGLREAA